MTSVRARGGNTGDRCPRRYHRAVPRKASSARVIRPGDPPSADPVQAMTTAERLDMMWSLERDAWAFL